MFSGTPRKQIILRSRGLRSDAFGALFSQMFDNLMANLGAFSVGGEVAAMGGGDSHGVSGSLKASYAF